MSKYDKEIEKLLADDSFVAWLEGAATDREGAKWEAWLASDPARKQLVEEAWSIHQNFNFKASSRPEMGEELKRLQEAVSRHEGDQEQKREIPVFRINRPKTYSSVAAVILLLVTVLSVVTFLHPDFHQSNTEEQASPEFITQSTQNGQQKVLTLSDGSKITLNANSSLRYPAQYTGGDLEVWLDGEAYFDITRKVGSDTRSFSVNIPGGEVEVLGTTFNVNAYAEATEVVLVQGNVNVKMRDSLGRDGDSYVMEPGELSRLSRREGNITTHRVATDRYTAWTQDKLIFDRTPLSDVAKRIEHIYGVQFQLDTGELKETLVSGSLPNNDLNAFLNTLESLLDRSVTNKDGYIVFDE